MKVLLTPVGSHGDVHPFVALGRELAKRGHQVVVITNEMFRPLVEQLGLEFVPHGTAAEFQEVIRRPEIWQSRQGTFLMFEYLVGEPLRALYRLIAANAERNSVVVSPSTAFGARIAHEKLGIPLATIHLAPASLRSVTEPALLPGMPPLRWLPLWARRGLYWFGDVLIADRWFARPINAFRQELGLPAMRRLLQWWDSPQRIIALFPHWFAQADDWPTQVRLAGFPLYDERDQQQLPGAVAEFLQDGSAPLVFTPGSANVQAERFFRAALAACGRLKRRALFLTMHREHLPDKLPADILHATYVPFSLVLPRAAAIIHHGGIGTTAQALAAGLPQLIMPMGFDQFDNASRCQKLGVGRVLAVRRFTGASVARQLGELLSASLPCREVASRLNGAASVPTACDLIEELSVTGGRTAAAR